jgi:PAS domain S-box-containing protein
MQEHRSVRVGYSIAVAAVAVAILVRWLLNPVLGHRLPFNTLFAAVAIAVWFGGWRPALLATVLGYLAAELLFIETEPGTPISIVQPGGVAGLAMHFATCLVVIALGSGMRSARRRFEETARDSLAKQATLEREVAEREATESVLRAKEAELALITQRTPLQLSRCSKALRYVFVNRAYASFVGRPPESIIGRPIVEILGEQALAAIRPYIERVLRGEVVEYETEIPYPHPGPRFMHVVYTPDRDEGGQVIGWIASIIDVSERRRNEEALRRSEEQLATELAAMTRMQQVSTRLVRAGAFSDLLGEILDAAIEITRADMGNIQLLEGSVLKIVSHRGFDAAFLDFFSGVEAGQAVCGTAMRSRERVVVEDVASSQIFAGTPAREVVLAAGVRAVQSTPLVSRSDTLLGMLSTHYRASRRPSEHELRILDVLGRQASDLIERARSEAALREADRQKDEFLAMLAHELRNPLAPIRTAVELLRLEPAPSPEASAASEIIDRQTRQLARLIDDLMDISRITRNRLELRRETVELAQIVEDAVETSRPLIDERGHTLDLQLPGQPVFLDGDATRLAQVFSNLLNNAARYSEPGGRIRLAAEPRDGGVSISIRDSGMGISSAQLPRIFEGDDLSTAHSHDGLGIGLMLVRRLVEMHGGSVEARSEGPGNGSEFVVRLPIVSAPAIGEAQPRETGRLAAAPARRRVLVADDNRDAATTLTRMLERLGYETLSAHDGLEAFELASAFRPDVLLLDLGMPRASGLEVAHRIRLQPWGQQTVLVAITGWGQAEDKQRTGAAGFDHHLVKPVSPQDLATLLASFGSGERAASGPDRGTIH